MKNKPRKKMLGPTLQLFELVPITDPAELAAIDRRRKLAQKAMKVAEKAAEKAMAAFYKAEKRKARKRK